MVEVIVLNGGSSSGTTSLAVELQALLPGTFLRFGVDTLVDALPPTRQDSGIEIGPDGSVAIDERYRRIEDAWYLGLGAIARAGVGVIVDEVFVGAAGSQARLRSALAGLTVLWVGVHCDPEVAADRERARGDRTSGMAATQAAMVHAGVAYDLVVDTSSTLARDCAQIVADEVIGRS